MLTGVGLLAGCAGGSGVSVPQFPGREEVAQMKSTDAPETYFEDRRSAVESWELIEPLPDKLGHQPVSPRSDALALQRVIEASGRAKPVETVVSRQMTCAARQIGHFRLQQDANPEPLLRTYMTARCGVPSNGVAFRSFTWEDPEDATDRELLDAMDTSIDDVVRGLAQGNNPALGAALVRTDDAAALVVTGVPRKAAVDPVSLTQTSGSTIDIRGRLLVNRQALSVSSTQGAFGTGDCEVVDDVRLPEFHIRCPRDAESKSTQINISGRKKGAVFATSLLQNRFWNEGGSSTTFETPEIGAIVAAEYQKLLDASPDASEVSMTSSEALDQFERLVNAIRARAGLEPASVHPEQSAEVRRLAGDLFNSTGGTFKQANRTILGLLAGWKIDEPISQGSFQARRVYQSTITAVVTQALDTPSGRETLLSEGYDTFAISLTPAKRGSGIGFTAFSYHGVPEMKFSERRSLVIDQIDDERRSRGMQELDLDGKTYADCRRIAQRLEAGSLSLRQAQKRLMEYGLAQWNTGVRSNVTVTQSLEDVTIPSRLLDAGLSRVALVVAPFQPKGAAWTSYAIMWVVPSGQTA
jgi:hypothetical protein